MTFFQHIQYYFVLVLFLLLSLIPLSIRYYMAEFFAFIIYNLIGYRKHVVFDNLEKAFPNKSKSEIEIIAKKFYRHFACLIVENLGLRFVGKKTFKKRYILENREVFEDLYRKGKSVINMTAHLGNWEYGSGIVANLPHKGVAVYKKLSNPVFDKLFFDIRQRLGNKPIEMNDVLRGIIELNKSNELYLLSMVTDQAPTYSKTNHWVNFLNQDTNVFLGSEKIARKFNMAVTATEIVKKKRGVYTASINLITENAADTKEFEITEKYFELLEKSIQNYPEYWLWSHRRWKHKRDKVE